jgi:hypothetical protein
MSIPHFVLGLLSVVVGYLGLLHVLNNNLMVGLVCFFLAYCVAAFNLKSYIEEMTK